MWVVRSRGATSGLLRFTLYFILLVGWTSGQPDFAAPLNNVSVPVGRDATFSCIVNELGGYRSSSGRKDALQWWAFVNFSPINKNDQLISIIINCNEEKLTNAHHCQFDEVGWVKADTKAIQAIHKHVITHNTRVSVSHSDHNTWMLHIRGVQEEDRGPYMCQINTDPMRSQIGYLEVTVPPKINDEQSSSDVMVPEGSNAVLVCRANGYPRPKITWKREDKKLLVIRKNDPEKRKVKTMTYDGEMLNLTSITRSDMGPYLCIANNNVPPIVSKRITVDVTFRPVIHVPNQLIGVPMGSSATLQCNLEASPKSIQYWTRDTGEMLITNSDYKVDETLTNYYMTSMTLTILSFAKRHEGMYYCSAKNSLGETEGDIKVYEIQLPTEPPVEEEDMSQGERGYTGSEMSNEVIPGDGNSGGRSRAGSNRRQDMIMGGHVTKAGTLRPPGNAPTRGPPRRKMPHPTTPWFNWDPAASSARPAPELVIAPLLCLAVFSHP